MSTWCQLKTAPWRFSLSLEQRIDLAQHFLTSAAIAAGSRHHVYPMQLACLRKYQIPKAGADSALQTSLQTVPAHVFGELAKLLLKLPDGFKNTI